MLFFVTGLTKKHHIIAFVVEDIAVNVMSVIRRYFFTDLTHHAVKRVSFSGYITASRLDRFWLGFVS